ncbi:hypothetical protein Agabi119p4_9912 [Agaricus bisporus var. burnettii]|uniref:Transposase family Tnp2 protein n=1 Tax=Agaricus bisporus var. burnettii TaxID=192524 RepID=A0A8H7EXS1_AGABI|nr:hypothetical protein Agabi119p4_9912 [Agaricus bisporus var. burnettii]
MAPTCKPSKVKCTCPCGAMVAPRTRQRHLEGRAKTVSLRALIARKRSRSGFVIEDTRITKKRRQNGLPPPVPSFPPDHTPPVTADDQLHAPESLAFPAGNHPLDEDQSDADIRRATRVERQTVRAMQRTWGDTPQAIRRLDDEDNDEDRQEQLALSNDALYDFIFADEDLDLNDDPESNDEIDEEDDELRTDMAGIYLWDKVRERSKHEVAALDNVQSLGEADIDLLLKFTLKVEDRLSDRTFARMERVFRQERQESLKMTKKRVRVLSGLQPIRYSCCINSCVCFTGHYEHYTMCPNPQCNEPRFNAKGQPRKYFAYLPIIPRLLAMLSNRELAQRMRYRAEYQHQPGVIRDVFDGSYYQSLLQTVVPTDDDNDNSFFYFSDPRDIALGLSTDGFAPFKRRSQTCWPIILFVYNLAPDVRFQKKYRLRIGVIPGPRKPWDPDSYFWPLIQELIQLEAGVKAWDATIQAYFLLHAYLILLFGDIPAMALIMNMKGSNAVSPCRVCSIKGICNPSASKKTNYVPLRRDTLPNADPVRYDPRNLPIRSHGELMEQAIAVQMSPTNAASEDLAKRYGIKGIPVLSNVSAISFPESFPFDFMHLIWENLIPNLISFWIGEFKDLDHGHKGYFIGPQAWEEIGRATEACGSTIPSAFGARVPNIAKKQSQMSAEMYSNWTLFIAPIVLRRRFPKAQYYKHFLKLVELLKLCLSFEIDQEMLLRIEEGFVQWVWDYERFYYCNVSARLSACPLTLHALLHIAWGIRVAGPVWSYWAFPMERECNNLLCAIKSRRHPYESINSFMIATAQLDQIRLMHNLHDVLNLDPPMKTMNQMVHESYPTYKLWGSRQNATLPKPVSNKIQASLATRFNTTISIVRAAIKLDAPLLQYGKVTCLGDGDTMVACDIVGQSESSRDASFVKYILRVDRFARQRRREPEYVPCTYYGQLKRLVVLDLPIIPELKLDSPSTIIIAIIQSMKEALEDGVSYCQESSVLEAVDLNTLECVVGRVRDGNRWGIVDRSNAVTQIE